MRQELPSNMRELADGEGFQFNCHPGVDCFTDCCRELELALTPYDVLRLKNELKLTSAQFMDQYCLVECEKEDIFPRVYLGMVDDGKASCPFVTEKGCTVYQGRPGACRTYPLARGASRTLLGRHQIFHVLLREPHCHGFAEPDEQTIVTWTKDQGLEPYNEANDRLMAILQHVKIKNDMSLTVKQQQLFLDTLFNLEGFQTKNKLSHMADKELYTEAVNWLQKELFG